MNRYSLKILYPSGNNGNLSFTDHIEAASIKINGDSISFLDEWGAIIASYPTRYTCITDTENKDSIIN